MTDAVETTTRPATIEDIQRPRVTAESFAPWLPTFRRWVDTVGLPEAGMRYDWLTGSGLSSLATLTGANGQSINNLHYTLPRFALWLVSQGITEPEPVVPQGGQVTVAPIGPDTPGWTEWWDRLYEVAHEDDGYVDEYNTLARTFGGPLRDDDEEVDVDVTITIPSFTIRLSRTVRRTEANTDYIGEYINESDVDDAIRNYIRENSVDYEIDEVEIDE